MTLFRVLLAAIFVAIAVYTLLVIGDHGLNLFPYFFGDIGRLGWPGQFNVDFMGFLVLSATWLAWRHHFSPAGLALGVGGFFLGAPFLTAYLFIMSFKVNGDMKLLLIGEDR